MVVVGNTNEALASAMAFCARDVISNNSSRRSPVPPPQLIAFFNKQTPEQGSHRLPSEAISSLQNAILFLGPSIDDYQQILANALQLLSRISKNDGTDYGDPMLHTSIDFGTESGFKTMQSLSVCRNRFSFLGLNLNTSKLADTGGFLLSREKADDWGNKLQTLLDGDQLSAAVTMDIRTHLAMLQANSLPRSRGVLGEKDIWAITDTIKDGMHIDNGDGMLLEYQFNYNDPFGGCDPLLCPSSGMILSSPTSAQIQAQSEANDAYAAAYSAMIGSGMDPLSSICMATSVKAAFRELGMTNGDGTFCPPSYSWNTIDLIAERSIKAGQSMRQEDGLARKLYKEFGYR
ncbi:hypothetical protein ACHAXR_003670 [Thalassiosira sp. AJA248-18]